jgi:hypothetical protein
MNASVDEHYWDVYLTVSSDNGATWAPNTLGQMGSDR